MHRENSIIRFSTEGNDAFIPYLKSRLSLLSGETEGTSACRDGRMTAIEDALEGHLTDMTQSPNSERHDPFSSGYAMEATEILKLVEYREDPRPVTIAVDFDNTLARSVKNYPAIGEEVPHAFNWLRLWQNGHGIRLILWTMRTGDSLADALEFCAKRGITFWGVNENPAQVIYPHPASGKCYSDILIDDTALGCPLDEEGAVNWAKAGPMVSEMLSGKFGL